ncbi:MAG: GxxExxY protein [Paludibacteraceae bacterium]|nr:GxxExxY protein [Paludibacteraceae bacterium]
MTEERQIQLANIAYDIIGAAMEVHREYGFGISEGVYEEALCIELDDYGYETEAQCDLPVYYKGQLLEKRFRMDVVVEKDVIIELKAVDAILPEHRAQLYNYLRLTKKPIGLLINFGKSLRAEKYIYDPETNEIDFFNVKSNRQLFDFDE